MKWILRPMGRLKNLSEVAQNDCRLNKYAGKLLCSVGNES